MPRAQLPQRRIVQGAVPTPTAVQAWCKRPCQVRQCACHTVLQNDDDRERREAFAERSHQGRISLPAVRFAERVAGVGVCASYEAVCGEAWGETDGLSRLILLPLLL